MSVGTVMRAKREEKGWTQKALASKVGRSESSLRMYELEFKTAPHDICNRSAAVLGAPEICFAKCSECPANWLDVCLLNADLHPAEEILRALEETQEAIDAVMALASKATGKASRAVTERACDQVLDLVTLAAAAVASWCRAHGLRMEEVSRKHHRKMIQRGHVKEAAA